MSVFRFSLLDQTYPWYNKVMRLDKLLGQAGYGSRNQVKKLIRSRQVYVDGVLADRDNLNVDASLQTIMVSGKELEHTPEVYYLMNKPAGVVSARKDKEHQTVIDLIKPKDQRDGLYPVGRLDRDTEGLVLITNNGPLGFACFTHAIMWLRLIMLRSMMFLGLMQLHFLSRVLSLRMVLFVNQLS